MQETFYKPLTPSLRAVENGVDIAELKRNQGFVIETKGHGGS